MKKYLAILSVLLVAVLFTGCSLFPANSVENEVTPPVTADLFDYTGLDYQSGEVLVRVDSTISLDKMLVKEGSEVLQEWSEIGWSLVSVPEGKTVTSFIKELRTYKGVLLAEPNMMYETDKTPEATSYDAQWGFKNMNSEAAWDITTGSENVIVAIVDTGLDVTHPEFEHKTIIAPYNATGDGIEDMIDADEHGTHVTGIAAADGNFGEVAGVAWDCPIMPVRAQHIEGYIASSFLVEAMTYIADYAQENPEYRIVVNMSIGGHGYNFAMKDAIDYAFDNGVLLITSAGNDSKRVVSYPSAYNGVVSVCASTPWDTKAEFSTEGSWNSIAAPGVLIYSTIPVSEDPEKPIYGNMQGTSMASPYVTGAAALLLSHNPDLTPLQVKNQIEQTARGEGFSEELGYGIIDIEAMLGELQPMAYGSLDVTTSIISTDELGYIGQGIVTLFDEEGTLVGWGSTGEDGNYTFHALKPAIYTVNLSYYNMFTGEYEFATQDAMVKVDRVNTIYFEVGVPSSITKTVEYEENIIEADGYKEIAFTVEESGFFEFETSEYPGECEWDTVLYLYDADDNLIVVNDDFGTRFSYIGMNLQAGEYTVGVEEFDLLELKCHFEIRSSEISY